MFAINSCQSLADNYSFLLGFHTALQIKTGLLDMLYQKSLRLTVDVRNARGVGTVVNLQSNDASKVWMMPVHIHTLWNSPFQVMIFLTTSCDLLISQLCSLAVVLDPSLVSLLSLPDGCAFPDVSQFYIAPVSCHCCHMLSHTLAECLQVTVNVWQSSNILLVVAPSLPHCMLCSMGLSQACKPS